MVHGPVDDLAGGGPDVGGCGVAGQHEIMDAVLDDQLENLRDLARWTAAHIASVVLDDERALSNAAFIRGIDIDNLQFDPDAMAARLAAACRETSETYSWRFNVPCMKRFRTRRLEQEVPMAVGAGV